MRTAASSLRCHDPLDLADLGWRKRISILAELHAYFETDMFQSELDDKDFDRTVLGEDCASWFRSSLKEVEPGEPIREDWGWALSVKLEGQNAWVMLQKWHATTRGWHVWVEPRGLAAQILRGRSGAALARLRDLVDRVISAEPRIEGLTWVADPGDLP